MRRSRWLARLGSLLVLLALVVLVTDARADDPESAALFGAATLALKEGRAGDAVASFEALADRGVVDAAASYDRGLAYALRVRIGAESPGDLGRAAHCFEEAHDLARDAKLADDAARALVVVRSEIARRRTQAGLQVEVDPGRSLSRTLAGLLAEDTWAWTAVSASALLAIGLFVRWATREGRSRVTGGIVAGVAAPVLALSAAMTLAARHDRLDLREAIVVTSSARPVDERGLTVAGAAALPEGARVEVVESQGPLTRVRFGTREVWTSASALRDLAR
jgi:hypothetical protein